MIVSTRIQALQLGSDGKEWDFHFSLQLNAVGMGDQVRIVGWNPPSYPCSLKHSVASITVKSFLITRGYIWQWSFYNAPNSWCWHVPEYNHKIVVRQIVR